MLCSAYTFTHHWLLYHRKTMLAWQMLLAIAGFLLLALYLQYRWTYRHILAAASALPCPFALPLLGNVYYFIGSISSITKTIFQLTVKFKGVFCIWIGPVPVFVVSDPSNVQVVLNSSSMLEKDDVYRFLKIALGNGLLTAPVPIWKKYRRKIVPLLHPSNIEGFMPDFNDVSEQLSDDLAKSGTPIDPTESVFNASMDASMTTLIGRPHMDGATKKHVLFLLSKVGVQFVNRVFKPWLHTDWLYNLLYRDDVSELQRSVNHVLGFIDQEWEDEEKIKHSAPESCQGFDMSLSRKTILNVAFNDGDDVEGHKWEDELATLVAGATDTVVATVSFLLYSLAANPEIQDKVYEEIRGVVGGSRCDVTAADLKAMTYLGQALMETMRLHGVFPVILRRATKETKLANVTLPAGSRVLLPLHAMGWDRDLFPRPDRFTPERFAPEQVTRRPPYAFLPFSGGPRNCPGKPYAMMLMKTAAVHVLQKYRITTKVRQEDIEYELKVVMFSKTPLLLEFEPR